jgi:type IV pilus assembly protein PilF
MRNILFVLVSFILVTGCAGTTPAGNSNLRPNQGTNQVALTNLNLAIEYMRNGNMETALEKLNRAYEADPRYYGTHNAYGLLYQRLGDPALAERHFKRAIDLNNNDSMSKNNYGNFLCQARRFEEAEKVFVSAASNPLYETPAVAWTNAGTCAFMNNRADLAEKYFREALTINPQIPTALLTMSRISYDQDNFLSARGYLQRYQAVARNTAASLLLGIKIEKELGDRNAVASYEMLLRNNYPDSTELQELRNSRTP